MPKKIYDIKPPKVARKKETANGDSIKEFLKPEGNSNNKRNHRTRNKKDGRSIKAPFLITASVIILMVGVYLFFKLPKADIFIWPKVDTLSFQQTITADKSVDLADIKNSVIPAQYFEATETVAQDFPATGNASNEGRASGTITVFNKIDPVKPMTLVTGTHFMSDSGKLFVASKKIVVPAATKSGSKITPGSVQVQIQAVEGGSDYNIAPSNFSIPGLKGTTYYYSVYAISSSAMTGGYAGKVKKVTDDDIRGAKELLDKKATDDAVSALKDQVSSDYILLDGAVLSNIISSSTQTKSGTVIDSFNYQSTVKASALAFKKSNLDKFAKDYIVSKMPDGKTLLENSLKVDYSSSVVDVSGGKATINLDFSAGTYGNIDKNSISLSLLGQNTDQMKETLNNILGDKISKFEIKFWPFWVTKVPNSQKSINVQLNFE